jgi:hypothetical protein
VSPSAATTSLRPHESEAAAEELRRPAPIADEQARIQAELGAGVAVLIPCYNEEMTIGSVVRQFRTLLPGARVYVFDNNSSDRTVDEARSAGAHIFFERRQGKGYVVQSMFSKVEADVYVMVDGDGTYPPNAVESLIEPIRHGEADMVIGSRLDRNTTSQIRMLNRFGNKLFLLLLKFIFGVRLTDLLSGYRAFSRRLVRGLPLFGGGFETEAELTIKALQRGFRIVEAPVNLSQRPAGSHSKIRIMQDGFVILSSILTLFRDYRPLTFFGAFGVGLILLSLLPGAWAFAEYTRTGLVNRVPSAVLATGLVLTGVLGIVVGLILHTIARHFQEVESQLQTLADDLRRAHGLPKEGP